MMWDFFIAIFWICLLIGCFNNIFDKWRREEEELDAYLNPPEERDTIVYYEDDSPMTKNDWNVICRTAVENAKSGDSRARDWVMKNIISEHKNESPFAKDAIDYLVSLGFKKKEAESKVIHLTSIKTYNNLEDLIKDAISHK